MKNHIYIGYDPKEHEAYEVARHSILSRTNPDVISVDALKLKPLRESGLFYREFEMRDGKMWCPISDAPVTTEFSISRFAVPFLQAEGWHLFIDCDVVCQEDIQELFKLADEKYAVMVVKHKQESGALTKADGQIQTFYARKNWSSVVLWNCAHPSHKQLTVKDLNEWPGRDLHAFKWLKDEEIGELPHEWNHLVGVDPTNINAKMLHYTLGGPWFNDWGVKYLEDHIWWKESRDKVFLEMS